MDIRDQQGSPYWKILIFSVAILFSLIVIRIWVLEIAIGQGLVSTLQSTVLNQLTLLPGDAATVTNGQNYVMFGLRRLCELLMAALIIYNIVYLFRYERQQYV